MKTNDALLHRIKTLGEAAVGTITSGLIFSDEETIHERLLFYRDVGIVSFYGNEINDRTVIKAEEDKSGGNKRFTHRDTRKSAKHQPRLSQCRH